jgi:hypothetical protein
MALAEARRYLEAVANVPRPDEARTARFIDHVVGARPWHTLLPTFPPGAPFVIYLDPEPMDVAADGSTYPRTAGDRDRLGFWSYVARFGEPDATPGGEVAPDPPERPTVRTASGVRLPVPDELRRIATCRVTCWVGDDVPPELARSRWQPPLDEAAHFTRYAAANRDDPEVKRYQPLLALAQKALTTATASADRPPDVAPVGGADDWADRLRAFHDAERQVLRGHLADAARRALWYYRLSD